MALKIEDVEKLVKAQGEATTMFFGTEVPPPSDRLFVVTDTIRREKLLKDPMILFAPGRSFPEGITFPGQRVPMSPNLYRYMREGWVDADANTLPGGWWILDTTQGADYNGGTQMYADTKLFKDILSQTRRDYPEIVRLNPHVPKPSRFAFSPHEIDGSRAYITTQVADILKLEPGEEVSTMLYSIFYYAGNMYPDLKFGDFRMSEWFKNNFRHGDRLNGDYSRFRGLSYVYHWYSDNHRGDIGFRLQIGPF